MIINIENDNKSNRTKGKCAGHRTVSGINGQISLNWALNVSIYRFGCVHRKHDNIRYGYVVVRHLAIINILSRMKCLEIRVFPSYRTPISVIGRYVSDN